MLQVVRYHPLANLRNGIVLARFPIKPQRYLMNQSLNMATNLRPPIYTDTPLVVIHTPKFETGEVRKHAATTITLGCTLANMSFTDRQTLSPSRHRKWR